MKNIQAQYQALLEGKMSKANFVRNVRMQFPQYISPVTSLDDSIRILKGKRILSESHDANTRWLEDFNDQVEFKIKFLNLSPADEQDVRTELGIVKDNLLFKYAGQKAIKAADEFVDSVLGYNDPEQAKEDERIDHLRKGSKELEELNEAEKKTPSIDHVDYIQLTRGTEFELSKMRVLSDENYLKAKEKAYKKLVKNPNAYRHLTVANYAEVEKKDKVLKPQEVKKGELSDKPNQMKTLKKDATPNTKDNLGKKEKRKGMPDGVKQLKEEMMREFGGDAIPEIKRKFAKGHEVVTPEGKVGHIEELTEDNTATVVHEDGTKRDYQANVLKTVDEDRSERDIDPSVEHDPETYKHLTHGGEKTETPKYNGIGKGSYVEINLQNPQARDAAESEGIKINTKYKVEKVTAYSRGDTQSVTADLENLEGGQPLQIDIKYLKVVPNVAVPKRDLGAAFKSLKEKLVKAMKETPTARTNDQRKNQVAINKINKIPNPEAKKEMLNTFNSGGVVDL